MSLMIISRISDDLWIALSVSAWCAFNGLRIRILAKPMMPFKGVRIS